MSHRTLKQKIDNKKQSYGVDASLYPGVESIVYLPCDETNKDSTGKVFMLLDGGLSSNGFDFYPKTAGGTGEGKPPNQILVQAEAGSFEMASLSAAKSWFILGVSTHGALASWSVFKLGVETVNKGSTEVFPGQVEINYTNASADTLTYSTTYSGTGTVVPILMTCDRANDLLSVYEGGEGDPFVSIDTLSGLTAIPVAFPALTEFTANANTALEAYGFLLVIYEAGIELPANLTAMCEQMRDSWVNGKPLVALK